MVITPEQFSHQISLGENSFLECKEVVFSGERIKGPKRNDLADELAALANAKGGTLVLGVRDKTWDIVGLPSDFLHFVESYVVDVLRDLIDPPLDADIECVEVPDVTGRLRVLMCINVPRSPYLHKSPSGYFRRVGSSKRELRQQEMLRLAQQKSQASVFRFDEQVAGKARFDDLRSSLVDRFRTQQTLDDRRVLARKLGMALEDEDEALRPTVAGVLLGTDNPQRWLPNAYIQAVAYRGKGIGESMDLINYQLDAQEIGGALDAQVIDACKFILKNQKVAASKGAGREDHPQYDITAVFEALVNAVAHRDYSIHGSKIRLRMFSDRMELYSPGELPNSLELDALAYRQVTRNEAIASLLAKIKVPSNIPGLKTARTTLMDRRGEGVGQILQRSKALSGLEPRYDMPGGDELRLTIFAARSGARGDD